MSGSGVRPGKARKSLVEVFQLLFGIAIMLMMAMWFAVLVLIIIGILSPLTIIVLTVVFFVTIFVGADVLSRLKIKYFKQYVKEDKLVLPEEVLMELGTVNAKEYRYTTSASVPERSGMRTRMRTYVVHGHDIAIMVSSSEEVKTKVVDLRQLCSRPFFLFTDRDLTSVIEAPGLKVNSGRLKDVVMMCLNPSSILEKSVELEAGDPNEYAKAKIGIGPRGFDVEAVWILRAPTSRKIVYDEKHGVYRVVEELKTKPKTKRVVVELCVQIPEKTSCVPLAKLEQFNKPVKMLIPVEIKEKLVFLDYSNRGLGMLRRLIKKAIRFRFKTIIAGYKPGALTARLVLESSKGSEVSREVPL